MSIVSTPVSVAEISERVRLAAKTDGWNPGRQFTSHRVPPAERNDFYGGQIQAALRRARGKTFVNKAKPLRRIFRNQEAVNESVIEAAHYLALQQQELTAELNRIREGARACLVRKRAKTSERPE